MPGGGPHPGNRVVLAQEIRWSSPQEIGWVRTEEIRWSSAEEIAWVRTEEIFQSHRIPLRALAHIQRQGLFSEGEIQRFIIPARTRRHREAKKERLTVEESDRLVRMARVQALAEDVFGDAERANRWLREPLGELSRTAPLDWARTEAGARLVEDVLAKIDWGAAA